MCVRDAHLRVRENPDVAVASDKLTNTKISDDISHVESIRNWNCFTYEIFVSRMKWGRFHM